MKLGVIVNSQRALENLSNCPLSISIAWELKKFIKAINPEYVSFEELRNQKVLQYGKKVEGSQQWNVLPENNDAFQKDMAELLNKDIDVTIPQFKISDLGNVSLSASDLIMLDYLIIG
jgi:hypothetical protein